MSFWKEIIDSITGADERRARAKHKAWQQKRKEGCYCDIPESEKVDNCPRCQREEDSPKLIIGAVFI